jgi:catechol 2,3-dioxygenase-like lactoylglutathione lyase family enzyme
MTLKRMDNVLIVVDDLEAVKAFFIELGLKLEGETIVEGPSVGNLIGLKDVRATLAMMRTPDGPGIELDKFHTPNAIRFGPVDAPMNTLGIRRVMFAVDDIDGVVARMRAHGAALIGETLTGHAREILRSTTFQREGQGRQQSSPLKNGVQGLEKGVRVGLRRFSAGAGLGFDGRGDIGRQVLRPSQCVANPRDFQLSRRDLACRLPALACVPERPFMTGEHATKDRRGTLLRLRVRAPETDEPFRAVLGICSLILTRCYS